MTSNDNPRAHLDQYAAALRDVRQAAGGPRPDHVTLPPGLDPEQASAILDRAAGLVADDRFELLAATIAGTLARHLPFVPAAHIGAVLLDLSQFMLGFVDHPDAAAAAKAAEDLPVILALVGQEMYSRGAR